MTAGRRAGEISAYSDRLIQQTGTDAVCLWESGRLPGIKGSDAAMPTIEKSCMDFEKLIGKCMQSRSKAILHFGAAPWHTSLNEFLYI